MAYGKLHIYTYKLLKLCIFIFRMHNIYIIFEIMLWHTVDYEKI